MKKKLNDSMKSKYILIILTAFCFAMILLSFTTDMGRGPLKYIAGYVITPIQNGVNTVGNWIADKGAYFQSSQDLVTENRDLQAKVDSLTAENSQLQQEKEELDRLRKLYELDEQYDYEKVGARIIANETGNWFSTFTIDKGSDDGFKVDMNVIADSGLVGIITEVGPKWSTVRSIIDDNSNVGGQVSTTLDTCIIAGDLRLIDEGKVNLVKLTDAENKVNVGDKVVTSNVSEKFLPGILIGYISELSLDSNKLTSSGYITPAVDFKHLQEVLVITELKQNTPGTAPNTTKQKEPVDDPLTTQTESDGTEAQSGTEGQTDAPSNETSQNETSQGEPDQTEAGTPEGGGQ